MSERSKRVKYLYLVMYFRVKKRRRIGIKTEQIYIKNLTPSERGKILVEAYCLNVISPNIVTKFTLDNIFGPFDEDYKG